MEDKVMVTIVEQKSGWEMDAEISSKVLIREIEPVLRACIENKNYNLFGKWNKVGILYKGYKLRPEETLEELGIWDGSILHIKEEK